MKSEPDIIEFTNVLVELQRTREQLTRTQEECTKLLLEKRELEGRIGIAGALAQVREFFEKFGVQILDKPAAPDVARAHLRMKLIREEFEEFANAWCEDNLVEIADALADMIYVILGTALSYGLPLDLVFAEVHRTNLAKEKGSLRDDGKIMKPEGWVAPDIAGILKKAGA